MIEPFYKSDRVTLYNADCLEVLRQLPDGSVDAVVTDPPYGVRKTEDWDSLGWFLSHIDDWMREVVRVCVDGVLWFGAGKTLPHVIRAAGFYFDRLLIWNKPPGSQFAGASANRLWYSIEPISVICKSAGFKKRGPDSEFGYSAFDARTIAKSKHGHPTTKPVELMEWLVTHFSDSNATILDPFMGSGTTGVAAIKTGRRFIGIELDPGYCEIAKKRIMEAEEASEAKS